MEQVMSPDLYLLWSTRYQGWASSNGGYTTEQKDAHAYTYVEALSRCKKHYDRKAYGLIPVSTLILEEIAK
jgi:hypothetical protein